VKSAVKTLGKLSQEMDTMGIKCFPVVKLAMALPAYFWDLEKKEKKLEKRQESPFDYSEEAKVEYAGSDAAMAILADLAYLNGASGEIRSALFDSSFKHKHINEKCPSAELASRGIVLSENSYAQHKSYESQPGNPCWYSVADEDNEVVYVVVRGTSGAGDLLSDLKIQVQDIDLCGHPCKVHSGASAASAALAAPPFLLCLMVFTGINASALFVIEDSRTHIAPFLAKGFSLVFTGHSLGAGTAALAAAHARSRSEDGYKDATAVTFACPGIISGKASIKVMKTFVTTFIYGFDVVPRASGVAIFKLLDKIFSNNWKEKTMEWLAEEAKKKVLEKMGTGVLGSIAGGILSSAQTPAKKKKKLKQPAQVQPEIEEGNA
jgi:hypothetical protein